MSKTSSKTHSELEHLRGEVKRLKTLNRQLRKRVKQLEKKEHFFDETLDDLAETNQDHDADIDSCPHCSKGIIERLDLKFVIIERCNLCEYSKRIKLNGDQEDS